MVRPAQQPALDEGDRQLLEQLNRLRGATIPDLCEVMGVTATAVRLRINRLQASGLISRETIKTDRGRPHHEYTVTQSGLAALGSNYADLALILWRELAKIPDSKVRQDVVASLKQNLVDRYGSGVHGTSPSQRLEQLKNALVDKGFNVEIDLKQELPILRENNCPYIELAASDPSICQLEQTVFEEILGVSVKLTNCCLDGHHCCEFELTSLAASNKQ